MVLTKTQRVARERKARKMLAKLGQGKYSLGCFREDADGRFSFELESQGSSGVTFDQMAEVSRLFQTKGINVSAFYDDSGCPTCGGSTEYTLEVSGALVPG